MRRQEREDQRQRDDFLDTTLVTERSRLRAMLQPRYTGDLRLPFLSGVFKDYMDYTGRVADPEISYCP